MAKAAKKPSVADVLAMAAEVDEEAIDAEIAELEKKLKKLKEAKSTIRVLKHGRTPRKPPQRKKKPVDVVLPPAGQKTIKQRVIDRLAVQSPAKPGTIAADTGLEFNQVTACLANYPDTFRKAGEGYALTNGKH